MHPIQKLIESGEHKYQLLQHKPYQFLLSSILAGAYLTLIGFVFWSIRQAFSADVPLGMLLACLFFGTGLCIIILTRLELFTSNVMYMTVSGLSRRTGWLAFVKVCTLSYAGNWMGALLVALLLLQAGALAGLQPPAILQGKVTHKLADPASAIFYKGILANWLVCLAVWVNWHLREEMARILMVLLIIFSFLFVAFEHSVANMGSFAMAWLANPSQLSMNAMGWHMLWCTLGNILGGGLGVGLTAWFLNKDSIGDSVEPLTQKLLAEGSPENRSSVSLVSTTVNSKTVSDCEQTRPSSADE